MSISYDRTTYKQIINDVREDVNEPELMIRKSDESIQVDILRSEQVITEQYFVEEQYDLRLKNGTAEYPIQDRPAILGISADSPMIVTTDGTHDLNDYDIIEIRDVLGIDVNRRYSVKPVDTMKFSLRTFVRISAIDISVAPVVVTTEEDHGYTTGDSIAIANTGVIDSTFSITVTDTNKFTVPVGASDEYSGGTGIATKATVGLSGYVAGGRFWREDEVPTHLWNFLRGERIWEGLIREVAFGDRGELVNAADYTFTSFNKGSFYSPVQGAHIRKNGKRFLKFWETPTAYHTCTLHAGLKVMPELYYGDPLTAMIHLDSQHTELIKMYVMAKAYWYCKKFDLSNQLMRQFNGELEIKKRNRPMKHKIRMVYR